MKTSNLPFRFTLSWSALVIAAVMVLCRQPQAAPAGKLTTEPRWWKGNLHTHSLWSDGDDFPEMIVEWYKNNGYHFLALSDHNLLQHGQRWVGIGSGKMLPASFDRYQARFGLPWVETRAGATNQEVRLKPLSEYRALFEEPGKFLMIPSEEITDLFESLPVHMNASNLREFIKPQGGRSVQEVMQRNLNALHAQRTNTGQPMILHLNHPNFGWGVTAEALSRVRGEHFFEVYNGHPGVRDRGDETHPSTDKLWDIALTLRLIGKDPEPLYGLAVDDSHHFHVRGPQFSNAGRGWIVVRASYLTPESIIHAMEAGDFYASSGVTLKSVVRSAEGLELEIMPQPGITYKTQFIGTRRNFNRKADPVINKQGTVLTSRYSEEVGTILGEVDGTAVHYRFKGDELYVRARIVSSKAKFNPGRPNEMEMAWTQPVLAAGPKP